MDRYKLNFVKYLNCLPSVFVVSRYISAGVCRILDRTMEFKLIVFICMFCCLWLIGEFRLWLSLFITFGVYLATGGWKFARIVIKTFPRDARALAFLIHSKRIMKQYQLQGENIVTLFQRNVRKHPNKYAFRMVDGQDFTFQETEDYSNQVANYFKKAGYCKGDVVAIFMESQPEYVCLWLGLAKIGVCPALINFNLRQESLHHCLDAGKAKGLIFSSYLASAITEIKASLGNMDLFCFGDATSLGTHLNTALLSSSTFPPASIDYTKFNEKIFYVYTSGTTGLPKAAVVIHSRFFYMATANHHFFKLTSDDVIYDTLPLYHTAGGILGVGQALIKGCTVVIRKKFSASRFWDDCIKYNCTVTQYIGEICRYLLAQPQKPQDKQHRVRTAFGNGLRPQIWREFQNRFNIERIGEFYGATEGNANIINIDNTVGAVGFNTRIAPALYPVTLIKVDPHTGEPVRDRNGVCIKCEPGEPGELVGKIIKGDPLREFDGYVNKAATGKKITHDVFKKGDSAFLTGDMLVMDDCGYMYFRDRTGDTFRWRGENVSTAEVEGIIHNVLNLGDAAVYGVEVPGAEGRAGMAAVLDPDHMLDLKDFHDKMKKSLPPYAQPLFIRLLSVIDTTGTFKLKKTEYVKAGFNPSATADKLFYLDLKEQKYKPIDKVVYTDIINGRVRF